MPLDANQKSELKEVQDDLESRIGELDQVQQALTFQKSKLIEVESKLKRYALELGQMQRDLNDRISELEDVRGVLDRQESFLQNQVKSNLRKQIGQLDRLRRD